MNRFFNFILLALLPCAFLCAHAETVRIKLGANVSSNEAQPVLVKMGLKNIRPLFPENPKFAQQRKEFGLDRWFTAELSQTCSPASLKAKIKTQDDRLIEYFVDTDSSARISPLKSTHTDGEAYTSQNSGQYAHNTSAFVTYNENNGTISFDDPLYPSQWNMQASPTGINLPATWPFATGLPDIVVAVIDGGIDVSHEDLVSNIYVNRLEIGGISGYDDDGNGYYDDIYGYNFVARTGLITPHSHGTHTAGIIAARNENSTGISGIAGGNETAASGVRIMSCQIFDENGGSANPAEALVYAAENGAVIAQCSWMWEKEDYYEQDVIDAIRYFTSLKRSEKIAGGICIFPAGNNGKQARFWPSCMPEVISVAATLPNGSPAAYSNRGEWVTLAAPGGYIDKARGSILSTLPGNDYGYISGTVQAAAHVAGVAALYLSHYGNADFTPAALKKLIASSVINMYGDTKYADHIFGSGMLSAPMVISQSSDSSPGEPLIITAESTAAGSVSIRWKVPKSNNDVLDYVNIYTSILPFDDTAYFQSIPCLSVPVYFNMSGQYLTSIVNNLDPAATYYIGMKAFDRRGKASKLSATKQVYILPDDEENPDLSISPRQINLAGIAKGYFSSHTITLTNNSDSLLDCHLQLLPGDVDDSTQSRVTLNEEDSLISLAPQEVRPVTLTFNLTDCVPGEQISAKLSISTENDDYLPISIPITARINDAPKIVASSLTPLKVKRGGKALLNIVTGDADQDAYTVMITHSDTPAKFVATNSQNVNEVASIKEDGLTLAVRDADQTQYSTIEISADKFAQPATASISLAICDKHGNEQRLNVPYEIEAANRAPLSKKHDGLSVTEGLCTRPIDLNDLFEDPDNDELTFRVEVGASWLATPFFNGSLVIFQTYEPGKTQVNVLATDPDGLAAYTSVPLDILKDTSGITSIEASGPTINISEEAGSWLISMPGQANASARIYSLQGAKHAVQCFYDSHKSALIIDNTSLSAGIYIILIEAEGELHSLKAVKH